MDGPLKWHGGKHYLAKKIVALMPPHTHYVEPFAGGLSVLLAKDPNGVSEVANDINGELTCFWDTLKDERDFRKFARWLESTPFSEIEWTRAHTYLRFANEPRWKRAALFFVLCRQSLAGRMDCFAPLSRRRTRRGMNEQASAWLSAIDGLPEVHERLKRVVILNQQACDVIASQDGEGTLFYCDPPYLHETRQSTDVYQNEMSREEHERLLKLLMECDGKVMLSGYGSELYDGTLKNWTRHTFELPNNAAGGKYKKIQTEVLWCNWR